MRNIVLILFALVVVPMAAGTAFAGQVEGTIQGFNCVTNGKVCPIGKEDPVVATERIFVLHMSDGTYYFVPNLDRAIMSRYIAKPVRITGTIEPNSRSVQADSLEVKAGDAWRVTWSKAMERDVARSLDLSGF